MPPGGSILGYEKVDGRGNTWSKISDGGHKNKDELSHYSVPYVLSESLRYFSHALLSSIWTVCNASYLSSLSPLAINSSTLPFAPIF